MPTAAQPALRAFEKYSKYPLALGLSEFATLDEDGCDLSGGCEELGATFPWALHLHPRVASPPLPDGAPNTAFVDALLATVAPETVLYDVYAAASPDAVSGKDARVERIGRVVATSVAIPSPAGSPIVWHRVRKITRRWRLSGSHTGLPPPGQGGRLRAAARMGSGPQEARRRA